MKTEIPNLWIKCPQSNPQANLRLFCLPYAGGGTSIFRLWPQELPSNVELCAIELPGRENRIREKPISDIEILADNLVEFLLQHLDKPFAIFGHSMGSRIAYNLTRKLHQRNVNPVCLFVSGSYAPHLPELNPPVYLLSDTEFIEQVVRIYAAIPEVLLADKDLMELFLPILRADVTVGTTYIPFPDEPLDCPIFALGGLEDPEASHDLLASWRDYTRSSFSIEMFPGGHFYLNENENRQLLLQFLSKTLKDYL
ncbi:thioesterase II family protein [Microcoleus sp.]|uniref:thioesterase II family protein n=1 Tax=Microcoleus sp. TaxID=44472 RepID=UPI003523BD1D